MATETKETAQILARYKQRSDTFGFFFLLITSFISNTNKTAAWDMAMEKSKAVVNKMTLEEKISIATGVGWQEGACLGNIAAIPRLNFTGLCLQDSPAGIRFAKGVSVFPAGINAAATFDKDLIYERARLQGEEFRAKGVVRKRSSNLTT
jgi:beta-glucosidase-like glycosyl hydrolase